VNENITRRSFLKRALYWAGIAIPLSALFGIAWRFISMPFKIKLERKIYAGIESEIRQGVNERRDAKLALIRDGDAIRAVSLVCTHLGCIIGKSGEGFDCPCHGSRFSKDGKVLKGPAASPLKEYRVIVAEDKRVFVDMGEVITSDGTGGGRHV